MTHGDMQAQVHKNINYKEISILLMKIISSSFNKFQNSKSTVHQFIIVGISAAFLLLVPLAAMQFTDEVAWSLFDFFAAWLLLFGTGITYLLITRQMNNTAYKTAVGIAVATTLLIVWANLSVGIIGSENNPANFMYLGAIAVEIIGTIIARFRAHGMSIAMFATAFANALVLVIALSINLSDEINESIMILIPNILFIGLWIFSALLFRKAKR